MFLLHLRVTNNHITKKLLYLKKRQWSFLNTDINKFSLQVVCSLVNKQNPHYLQGKTVDEFVTWVFSELDMDKDGYVTEREFLTRLRERRDDFLGGIIAFAMTPQK